jgi:hypothetical protein
MPPKALRLSSKTFQKPSSEKGFFVDSSIKLDEIKSRTAKRIEEAIEKDMKKAGLFGPSERKTRSSAEYARRSRIKKKAEFAALTEEKKEFIKLIKAQGTLKLPVQSAHKASANFVEEADEDEYEDEYEDEDLETLHDRKSLSASASHDRGSLLVSAPAFFARLAASASHDRGSLLASSESLTAFPVARADDSQEKKSEQAKESKEEKKCRVLEEEEAKAAELELRYPAVAAINVELNGYRNQLLDWIDGLDRLKRDSRGMLEKDFQKELSDKCKRAYQAIDELLKRRRECISRVESEMSEVKVVHKGP